MDIKCPVDSNRFGLGKYKIHPTKMAQPKILEGFLI
jgi:hypothetical protein